MRICIYLNVLIFISLNSFSENVDDPRCSDGSIALKVNNRFKYTRNKSGSKQKIYKNFKSKNTGICILETRHKGKGKWRETYRFKIVENGKEIPSDFLISKYWADKIFIAHAISEVEKMAKAAKEAGVAPNEINCANETEEKKSSTTKYSITSKYVDLLIDKNRDFCTKENAQEIFKRLMKDKKESDIDWAAKETNNNIINKCYKENKNKCTKNDENCPTYTKEALSLCLSKGSCYPLDLSKKTKKKNQERLLPNAAEPKAKKSSIASKYVDLLLDANKDYCIKKGAQSTFINLMKNKKESDVDWAAGKTNILIGEKCSTENKKKCTVNDKNCVIDNKKTLALCLKKMNCYPLDLSRRTKKKYQDRLLPNAAKSEERKSAKKAESKNPKKKAGLKKLPKPIEVKEYSVAEAEKIEEEDLKSISKDRNGEIDFSYQVKKKRKYFPRTRRFSRKAVDTFKKIIAANEAGREVAPKKTRKRIRKKKNAPPFISLEGEKIATPKFRKVPKKIKKASRITKKPVEKKKRGVSKKSRSGRYPAFKYPGSYGSSLKNHSRPARGCLPVKNVSLAQAEKAMKLQNLTMNAKRRNVPRVKATGLEKRTLGAGLVWMQYLNGGPLKTGKWTKHDHRKHGHKHYSFNVAKKKFCNGANNCQRESFVYIRRTKRKTNLSVAQYIHEYGHLVGNKGGYSAYKKAMKGSRCYVSNYSKKKFNEEFAESFAAFITAPETLLNNNKSKKSRRACKRAFNFFKNWFKNGDRVYECLAKK